MLHITDLIKLSTRYRPVATRRETEGTNMLLHHHYTHRDNIDQIKIPF